MNRFLRHDVGDGILARSTSLEIRLHRIDGRMCGCFEITGKIGAGLFDDDDYDCGDTATLPADDAQFVRELLSEFQKPRP
jgi:hypothetical protein